MQLLKETRDQINLHLKNIKYWSELHEQYFKDQSVSRATWEQNHEECIDNINSEVDILTTLLHGIIARNTDKEIHKQCKYYFNKMKNI